MLHLNFRNTQVAVNLPARDLRERLRTMAIGPCEKWQDFRFECLVECVISHLFNLSIGPISAMVRWSGCLISGC
jgi:hypothetical protein